MKNESDCFDKLDYNLLQPTFCAYCVVMSRLSYRLGMGMGGIWELLDGKKSEWDLSFRWEWEWVGMKSLKWEGIGTKNPFPHISTANHN